MIPPKLHVHLLTLSEVVSILLAYKLTPDPLRQILCKLYKEVQRQLSLDDMKAVEAAEAKATLRALAYRRED